MKENKNTIINDIFGSTINIITNENNKTNIFWYTVMFIIIMYYFTTLEIGTNFVFGFVFAIIVIYILTYNNKQEQFNNEVLQEKKVNIIQPHPKNANKEIVNYLFSIQDFYSYNPQAYEDMVESIDQFFDRYEETLKDPSLAGVNYELMYSLQNSAINSLHSIIFGLEPNRKYDKKLEQAMKVLRNIFGKYLDTVIYINNKYNYDSGIHNTSKIISKTKVQPSNLYDDELISYEIV